MIYDFFSYTQGFKDDNGKTSYLITTNEENKSMQAYGWTKLGEYTKEDNILIPIPTMHKGGSKKRRRRIRTKQRKLSKKRKSKKKTKRRKTKRRRILI